MYVAFIVPSVPVAQPRQRVGVGPGGFARTYLPTKHPVNAFKASVRLSAASAWKADPLAGPLALTLSCVMQRPRAKVWKTRPMPRLRHTGKPDADNLAKSVMDALSGLLWRDDAQVAVLSVKKWIAAGDEQPHVSVQLSVLD